MVFFSCNACGESLKKNQVEKHYQFKCRNCEVLSCIDCSKEFRGDDYKQHIKCITEDEKYSGKNFQPKANANKGEKKQEAWFEHVQKAIDKVSGTNPKMKSLLVKLLDCPNVPRKQRKFENFVRSSLGVRDQRLVTEVWDAISSQMTANEQESQKDQPKAAVAEKVIEKAKVEDAKGSDESDAKERKLSKRERKEERRKQNDKVEKKDKKSQENGEEEKGRSKKSKKRKHQDDEEEEAAENGTEDAGEKKKRKKKRGKESSEETSDSSPKKRKKQKDSVESTPTEEEEEEESDEVPVQKFQWEPVIIEVLSGASDKTLSMKRLKKKVLAEYHARGGDGKKVASEEKLWAKFNKKVTKNPQFKVLKDKVKLVH